MTRPSRCKTTRRIVGVVLLALLLAQWQALVHGIAHGPRDAGIAIAALADRADHAAHADRAHRWGDGWGHPAGSPACDLFAALLGAQAPGFEPAPAAHPPAAAEVLAGPDRAPDAGPALRAYQARGPPRA